MNGEGWNLYWLVSGGILGGLAVAWWKDRAAQIERRQLALSDRLTALEDRVQAKKQGGAV